MAETELRVSNYAGITITNEIEEVVREMHGGSVARSAAQG